jgi:hypothetical protein
MAIGRRSGRRRSFPQLLLRALFWLVALAVAGAGALWLFGPALIAPREDFVQGPGGVVAYISLSNQLRSQTAQFLTGKDVRLVVKAEEFSGMVSSALLSGRQATNPITKVRASLPDGQIRVDMVLDLPYEQVPERFQGPVGVTLHLQPIVAVGGQLRFQITGATLGRIPVPVRFIKWAGQRLKLNINGYDPREATIQLPISDVVAGSLGRNIAIKQFTCAQGQLTLVMTSSRK